MTVAEPVTVRKDIPVRLLMSGTSVILTASFCYSTADPCAVKVVFNVGIGEEVEWFFSRDLLRDGLTAPSGYGDVKIQPSFGAFNPSASGGNNDALLYMELISPFGEAKFIMTPVFVKNFVDNIYELVPEDSVESHLNIDSKLAELLADGDI